MAINQAFIDAAGAQQIRHNPDFNGPDQEGVGLYQATQFHDKARAGQRCSAAAAYLHPVMARENLEVITGARATKISLRGKRATGVHYRRKGNEDHVSARKEVILCGGAFNSPQLLQISGIGDPADLEPHGLDVAHSLPGVGKNLQDHLDFIFLNKSRRTELFGIGLNGTWNIMKAIGNWRAGRPSILSTTFAESGGFLKTDPSLDRPDIQLHFVNALVDDHTRKLHLGYGYSCHVCALRPHSRGMVTLHDANPLSPPRIDPKYLSDERDMETMVRGVKLTRDILKGEALKPWSEKELYLTGDESETQLREHIRARADTIYHPVGTCKMGVDEMAVVDPQLRVHGMDGLRVVDASVMPTLIGGNTNAPTIMIAEKAAQMIKSGA